MHHRTQEAMLLGKAGGKEVIINMSPGGTPWMCSLQSISGTAAVAKGRSRVPSGLQSVLTDKERRYFGSSIYTAVLHRMFCCWF